MVSASLNALRSEMEENSESHEWVGGFQTLITEVLTILFAPQTHLWFVSFPVNRLDYHILLIRKKSGNKAVRNL